MSHDLKNLYCFFFLGAFLAPPLLELCVAYRTCDAPTTEGTRNLGIVGRAALVGVDRLSLASEARHCCVEAIVCDGGRGWCRAHSPEEEHSKAGGRRRRRDGGIANRESSDGSPVQSRGPGAGNWHARLEKKLGPGQTAAATALHRLGVGAAGSAFLSLLTNLLSHILRRNASVRLDFHSDKRHICHTTGPSPDATARR